MFGNRSHQPAYGGRSFFSTLVLGTSLIVIARSGRPDARDQSVRFARWHWDALARLERHQDRCHQRPGFESHRDESCPTGVLSMTDEFLLSNGDKYADELIVIDSGEQKFVCHGQRIRRANVNTLGAETTA